MSRDPRTSPDPGRDRRPTAALRRPRAPLLCTLLAGLFIASAPGSASPQPDQAAPEPVETRLPEALRPELTLQEAVRLALQNSPMLGQSQAQAEAARAASREAKLQRLPSLTARETAVRTDSPADVFGLMLMQERFSFPAFTTSDPNDPDSFDDYSSELAIEMPLFTGGALHYGVRQASRMAEAAAKVDEHTTRAVELGVVEAYLGALLADRYAGLAEKAQATTERHVEQAQAFYDTGMLVESDLLQAKVQLARMQENLLRAQNASRLAQAGLNRAMGQDEEQLYTLQEVASPDLAIPASYAEALQLAQAQRSDLKAVELQVEATKAGIGRARGEYFPQIGVMAKWNLHDDQLFGSHGQSTTLVARAEWKLWNWGQTHARVVRQKSAYRGAQEARRATSQRIAFEVRQAWQGIQEAQARVGVTRGAVGAAEKALSILEDRFKQGVARMTDLLDAETMAHEARVHALEAEFDLQKAYRTLNFSVGAQPVPEVN